MLLAKPRWIKTDFFSLKKRELENSLAFIPGLSMAMRWRRPACLPFVVPSACLSPSACATGWPWWASSTWPLPLWGPPPPQVLCRRRLPVSPSSEIETATSQRASHVSPLNVATPTCNMRQPPSKLPSPFGKYQHALEWTRPGGVIKGRAKTIKTSAFSTNAQSRFASIVLDKALGPTRLALQTLRGPCMPVVLEVSKSRVRDGDKGVAWRNYGEQCFANEGSLICPPGKLMIFYLSSHLIFECLRDYHGHFSSFFQKIPKSNIKGKEFK